MARKRRPIPPPAHETAPPSATGAGDKSAAKDGRKGGDKKKSTLREGADFIVMLAGAVLIALVIKAYALDVYVIPSGSMETALHGRPDGGDRIFCSKLNYRFRPPRRWEVAVFEFPYETARRAELASRIEFPISERYKGQNFVKRVVGLPGESLAIARGDIWVRPNDGRSEYTRVVKPDSVQRGMWLNVYEQDFSDIRLDELAAFWRTSGQGETVLDAGGPLRLRPGADRVRLDYRPLVPVGAEFRVMQELSGIPDRYTLRQPIQFRCRGRSGQGRECGHVFVKTIQTQNIEARCPKCGQLQDETSVIFYHRRTGLPIVGLHAVNPYYAPQGDETASLRDTDYHIVPDLRMVVEATFADVKSVLAITLREDRRRVEAILGADGRAEISVNGEPSTALMRAETGIGAGGRHSIEFYVVDGVARLFVDGDVPILDVPVWKDKRPFPTDIPKASGAALTAGGGEVALSRIKLDRDIFYYSGWERGRGEAQMNAQGEVFINENSFFPMGDHCTASFDARSWGPVPLSLIRGPALLVWWPPERVGVIPSP